MHTCRYTEFEIKQLQECEELDTVRRTSVKNKTTHLLNLIAQQARLIISTELETGSLKLVCAATPSHPSAFKVCRVKKSGWSHQIHMNRIPRRLVGQECTA